MHFALIIRRTAREIGSTSGGVRREYMREKGKFLFGGNSQGRDSLNRPLALVESFPFEMF